MKKFAAILLALSLMLTAATALAFEPVAKEDLKVGFMYVGGVEDKGYTYAHHQGTLKMMEALELTEDQVFWLTDVPEDSSAADAIDELIEMGCQIIFGNSYGYMDYFVEAAEENPDIIFSHCSGFKSNDTNMNNYFGAIYQARYLSGITAGLKTKTNLIGYVAAMPTPEVIGGFNAFMLGAQSVNPDVKMIVKYTNSWYDVTRERQTAEALLDLGCDVIGQHCDTTMPQVAAEARGVYGVGYNAAINPDEAGYNAWMTAPIWHWESVLIDEVQAVIDGTWTPENIFYGMKEGLIDLAPLSPAAPEGAQELIDAARAKIVNGEWDVFTGPIYDNAGNLVVAEGETLDVPAITSLTWVAQGIEVQ